MSQPLIAPVLGAPQTLAEFPQWHADFRRVFEDRLMTTLAPLLAEMPTRLSEAVRYAVLDGGKRLRPMLVVLGFSLTASSGARGALPDLSAAELEALWPAAIAIELIHCYSLIHDDLPAMDNDDLRRGKPTVHRAFDEPTAILAGDVLQTLAFDLLTQTPATGKTAPDLQLIWVRLLARGATDMVSGQQLDLAPPTQAPKEGDLGRMHRLKTGALLRSALLMGAATAQPDDPLHAILEQFIGPLGLAFQIQDDILDATGTAAQLGKTPGKDAAQAKYSYVTVLGQSTALHRLEETIEDALAALAPLGDAAEPLRACAHYVLTRNH
jgi:geranylgeranyl pyrophosphate synthase